MIPVAVFLNRALRPVESFAYDLYMLVFLALRLTIGASDADSSGCFRTERGVLPVKGVLASSK